MIEKCGGCALCLEWTSDHKRDSCPAKYKGKPFQMCELVERGVACGKKHHSLLHGATTKFCNFLRVNNATRHGSPLVPTAEDVKAGDAKTTLMQVQKVPTVGNAEDAITFFDNGSDVNLCTADYAARAGWKGYQTELRLQTTGRPSEVKKTKCYWAELIDNDDEANLIFCYEMPTITAPLGLVDVSGVRAIFPHLEDAELVRRPAGPVDILIGIHHASLFPWRGDNKANLVGNLRLMHSRFGTGLMLDGEHPSIQAGNLMQSPESHAMTRCKVTVIRAPKLVNRVMREPIFTFSECEEMGVNQPRRCGTCESCTRCSVDKQIHTRKENAELLLIEANIELDESSKQVKFKYPLMRDPSVLGDNRGQVMSMAAALERKLKKSGQLEDFNLEMEGFVHRDVFRELSEEEMRKWLGAINYISIHGVPKPSSATTKLRVVSNSSLSNNHSGLSYNSLLPKGPNSLVPLLSALIRWRSYEHCVVWDLTKAYNTVVTYEEEMHMRRLVWRWGRQDEEWTTFGITRMHFGDKVAMCGLDVALKRVAAAGQHIDPEASEMIKQGYVDDGLGGGSQATVDRLVGEETWEDGKPKYSGTVQQILGRGSFGLKVMVRSGEQRKEVLDLLGGGMLGLPWDAGKDKIRLHMGVNISPKKGGVRMGPELTEETLDQLDKLKMTRRVVVSQICGVFDPMGLLTPLTIKYRLLLQCLTDASAGWDDVLDEKLSEMSRAVLREMVQTRDIDFHRSVKPAGTEGPLKLAGWWDGGVPASCACLYARYRRAMKDAKGRSHVLRLLMGKARVTPSLKDVDKLRRSTPRTELRGLLLLCRMVTSSLYGLSELPVQIMLCGDSECTISAVECEDGLLQVWFSNRVAEVLEHMEAWGRKGIQVDKLQHWPGLSNIADIGTKGKAELTDIDEESEWQNARTGLGRQACLEISGRPLGSSDGRCQRRRSRPSCLWPI